MEKDSHRFIAANDNAPSSPAPVQGEFDFCQSPGKDAAPSPAKTSPSRARKSPTPPKPADPAQESSNLSARSAPASIRALPAEPEAAFPAPCAAEVASLTRERIARSPRIRELNEIADQAMKFMKDRALMAEIADTLQEEDARRVFRSPNQTSRGTPATPHHRTRHRAPILTEAILQARWARRLRGLSR